MVQKEMRRGARQALFVMEKAVPPVPTYQCSGNFRHTERQASWVHRKAEQTGVFASMCCSAQLTSALLCFIWETVSLCSLSWPRIHFVGQADLKLNILLPLPPKSCAHKDEVPVLALQNTSPPFLLTSIRSSCFSFDLMHSRSMPMLSFTWIYTILQCL